MESDEYGLLRKVTFSLLALNGESAGPPWDPDPTMLLASFKAR